MLLVLRFDASVLRAGEPGDRHLITSPGFRSGFLGSSTWALGKKVRHHLFNCTNHGHSISRCTLLPNTAISGASGTLHTSAQTCGSPVSRSRMDPNRPCNVFIDERALWTSLQLVAVAV